MARPRAGGLQVSRSSLRTGSFAKVTPGGNLTRAAGGRVNAVILNAPEVIAALGAVSLALQGPIAAAMQDAAANEIKDEWSTAAEATNTTGRGQGFYSRAIQVRDASIKEDAGAGMVGASGYVFVGTVGGVPEDEQPRRYAPVIEFGGQLTVAQHSSWIPAQYVARGAFDHSAPRAVDKAAVELVKGVAALGTVIP